MAMGFPIEFGRSLGHEYVTLDVLKHKTPIDLDKLRLSIARRFSRTVRGEMEIKINNVGLPDPTPALDHRYPDAKALPPMREELLADGNKVRYWYGFASNIIHERELRGFSILVHGKVAQAPPFFFDVEAEGIVATFNKICNWRDRSRLCR